MKSEPGNAPTTPAQDEEMLAGILEENRDLLDACVASLGLVDDTSCVLAVVDARDPDALRLFGLDDDSVHDEGYRLLTINRDAFCECIRARLSIPPPSGMVRILVAAGGWWALLRWDPSPGATSNR